MKANELAYEALVKTANDMGLLRQPEQRYPKDLLVVDRAVLTLREDGMPFLWGICNHGTHMVTPGENRSYHQWYLALANWWTRIYWFHWDGRQLVEVRSADLLDKIMRLGGPAYGRDTVRVDFAEWEKTVSRYEAEFESNALG